MNKKITILALVLSCFLFFQPTMGQQAQRMYFVGNSLTDNIKYDGLTGIVQSRGNSITVGSQRIPGAPLSWLWDHILDGFTHEPYGLPQNAFAVYTWDILSLQPFDRGIEGVGGDRSSVSNYYNLVKSKSPDSKVFIYGHWPRTPNAKTFDTCTKDEYNTIWTDPAGMEARQYYQDLTTTVRLDYPATADKIVMVPVGEVFYSLNNNPAFLAALAINSIWGLYYDGIHQGLIGEYICASTFYAMAYHDDPSGLGVPGNFGTIPPAALTIIQQTIKDVIIAKSAYTGISYFGPAPVQSVALNATATELNVSKTATLVPVFTPSNAANKTVSWLSSNPSVASVLNGVVTANAVGTAIITVTTTDGGKNSVCAVAVTNAGTAVTGIALNKATTSIVKLATETLVATISPAGATNKNVIWSSSDPSMATVSATGLVTAVKKGSATITATSVNGLFTASTAVTITTINTPPVAVMKYSPGNNGYAPYKVTFDGRSSYDNDPGDFVLGFDWVIKLQGSATALKTEVSNGFDYTFTTPGVYEVTLQAVDNDALARSLNTETVTITIADMPAVPVAETALCYEGFDYMKMAITDLNGGRGWKAGWEVQDPVGNDATGFAVENVSPITVANLRQSGNYMKLGHSSEQCGRGLDCSDTGAFENYITAPSSGVIGKAGTTLWFSTIIRPQSGNKTCNVSFNNSGVSWYGENAGKKLAFGGFGGTYWGLAFGFEGTEVRHLSTLPIVDNVPVFLVAKVDFGATNTVTLYLNPVPGNAPTGTPVIASTTTNLDFRNLGTTFTYDANKMGLDEIRFGASYADVAPAFVPDIEAPTAPANVLASGILSSNATLSWTASTDNTAVVGYEVFDGLVSKGTSTTNSKVVLGLSSLTSYNLTVKAYDAAGNFSEASTPVSFTTGNPDTTLPTNPSNLSSSSVTATSAVLTWTASTDNELLVGYEVYKDGSLIATPTTPTYAVSDLLVGTTYNFSVKAKDAAGNLSSGSASTSFTTLAVIIVDGVTARGENLPNESLANLTDGSLNSKWLDFSATSWVIFSYADAKTWNVYEITSGDDSPERDAKNWTIQGSMDSTVWTLLDTQTDQAWTDRKLTRSFTFSNTTAYNYYKWDITANGSGAIIQASEFNFLSTVTGMGNSNSNSSLSLYPNPVLDQLNLNFGTSVGKAQVTILDLQGRSLMTQSVAHTQVETLNVSSLSNGIYFVKVTADGKVTNSKFVKK